MKHIRIEYSSSPYSPECVLLAAQHFDDYSSVRVCDRGDKLVVDFFIDDGKIAVEQFQHRFNQSLNDACLRVILAEKTDAIRQMIVAQAFAPCDNLGEIIEAFEHHDR